VGSSPLTAAVTQGQDIKLFWILDDIADAEALIARNGSNVNAVKDLKGKKVATPFVSTAHYQLMAAMKLEGLSAKDVNVLNLRPPEIAAAWERGDIDAAFIWDPVLSKIKSNGKAIASSGSIGQKGYPTFDGIAVNTKWAAENEAFMVALVKALNKADSEYRANKASWTADTAQVKAIARVTKADVKDVPAAMSLYIFPTAAEQLGPKWLGGGAAKAMAETAVFLKEQGRIQEIKPDYKVFVTETREMTPAEFDVFASQLLKSRDWLSGKGGYLADGRLCVEVRASGRPTLYVDPSGGDYGRYVARLG
jgi:taurine transport system substrate-binding protein